MSVPKIVPGVTRLGWIGTGVMGQSMCSHLISQGYSLTVYNRSRTKAQALLERGAAWGNSPRQVAQQSDVVFAIVGFPRESDVDFQATRSLMEEIRFGGSYVFMYSVRPGTPAEHLTDDIPEEVKRVRCNDLLALQLEHQQAAYQALHGSVKQVLVEGPSRTNADRLQGRSNGNLNIVFPRVGADGHSRDSLIGRIVPVRIERSTSLTLFGDVVV